MESFRILIISLLTISFSFLLIRCGDDETVTLYDISGTVTYPDGLASGAVVYLGLGVEGGTNFDRTAIAEGDGTYNFSGLEPGEYRIWANYDTENTNLPDARLIGFTFRGEVITVTIGEANIVQDIDLPNSALAGVNVDTFDETTNWSFDKTHSEVFFEFPFDGENAVFTGYFRMFDIEVRINDSDLSNAQIEAWVDVTTPFTSQPGRDGTWTNYGEPEEFYSSGCIGNQFGATTGRDDETVLNPDKRYATFESTSVELFADGYKVQGSLTFNGITAQETLYLKYLEGFEDTANERWLSSFEGKLTFTPNATYQVDGSHLDGDKVTLYISCQLRQSLAP